MIDTALRKSLFVMAAMIFTGCGSTRQDKPSVSTLKDSQDDNRISCEIFEGMKTMCKLTGPARILDDPGIDALYNIRYIFNCTPSDGLSELEIFAEGSPTQGARIPFATSTQHMSLSGRGGLVLRNSDPINFGFRTFQADAPCYLQISAVAEPSSAQVNVWSTQSNSIIARLGDNLAIYASRSTVEMWYRANIQNPEVASLLQSAINGLSVGNQPESNKLVLRSLIKIRDNEDSAAIFSPFNEAKVKIEALVAEAESLAATMRHWNQVQVSELDAAREGGLASLRGGDL